MPARSLPVWLVTALALVGCGGSTDIPRPSGERVWAEPVDQCALGAAYTDVLGITAFDTTPTGSLLCGNAAASLQCSFYNNWDTKHSPEGPNGVEKGSDCQHEILNGQFVESGVVEVLKTGPETTERCGESVSALHFTAANLGMCVGKNGRRGWGSSYEIDFGPSSAKAAIDASEWDGFYFWVKRGSPSSESSIIVLTVDNFGAGASEQTDPVTGAEVSCVSADPLVATLPEADISKCDPFAAGVTLTDDWTFVPIRFADLKQKGFGTTAPLGLETSKLLRLQFLVTAGNWDFWLDDVTFFRDP